MSQDDVGSAIHMTVDPASTILICWSATNLAHLDTSFFTISSFPIMRAMSMSSTPMRYPAVVMGPHARPHMWRSSGSILAVSSRASTKHLVK